MNAQEVAELIAEKYQGAHWRVTGQNLISKIVEAIEVYEQSQPSNRTPEGE